MQNVSSRELCAVPLDPNGGMSIRRTAKSNLLNEIEIKRYLLLLSSFLEGKVLLVVPDRYDFKFSIKAIE